MQGSLKPVRRRREDLPLVQPQEASRALTMRQATTDPFVEEFRLLAMNVIALMEDTPVKALSVFSHSRGDGRTLVAVELARALAGHTDVLLIDGHTKSAGVHESLLISGPSPGGQQPRIGIDLTPTDHRRLWLFSGVEPGVAVDPDLHVNIGKALAAGMIVVVDAPAANVSSDAFLVAKLLKNVLYVMRNKPQDMAPHRRAMDHLRRLNVHILGIVLNDR